MGDKKQSSGQTSPDAAALRKRAEDQARNMESTFLGLALDEEK